MPSISQLTVVPNKGSDNALGYIDPKVGMITVYGAITAIDTNKNILTVGDGQKVYTGLTQIASGNAGHSFSWPTGDGSFVFGSQNLTYVDVYSGTYHDGYKAKNMLFAGDA